MRASQVIARMLIIVTNGIEQAGKKIQNLPKTIAENRRDIILAAMAGVVSLSILVYWIQLAVACTAFWLATIVVGFLEKMYPKTPNLVKITVAIGAGALAILICEFVVEFAFVAVWFLTFETLQFFWEAYKNELAKETLQKTLQVLPEPVATLEVASV